MKYAKSDNALAEACHVSFISIRRYKRESDFPAREQQGWPIRKVQDWIASRADRLEAAKAAAKQEGKSLEVAKINKYLAETRRITLKYEHERGQMTTRAEYMTFVRKVVGYMLEMIDRMVKGISAKLRDPEALKMLEAETNAVRQWFVDVAHQEEAACDPVGDLPDGE